MHEHIVKTNVTSKTNTVVLVDKVEEDYIVTVKQKDTADKYVSLRQIGNFS